MASDDDRIDDPAAPTLASSGTRRPPSPANPGMYGAGPSEPARAAAELFSAAGARRVLELGAGQGRDTLFLAGQGFTVSALDFALGATEAISAAGAAGQLAVPGVLSGRRVAFAGPPPVQGVRWALLKPGSAADGA